MLYPCRQKGLDKQISSLKSRLQSETSARQAERKKLMGVSTHPTPPLHHTSVPQIICQGLPETSVSGTIQAIKSLYMPTVFTCQSHSMVLVVTSEGSQWFTFNPNSQGSVLSLVQENMLLVKEINKMQHLVAGTQNAAPMQAYRMGAGAIA